VEKNIELMAEKVHSEIISCSKSAKCFSITAEQLFVTIGNVDVTNKNNDNDICEWFLGLPL
jgi:hypothetical protein